MFASADRCDLREELSHLIQEKAINIAAATQARARGIPTLLNAAPTRHLAPELTALIDEALAAQPDVLAKIKDGKVQIMKTPNGENPLVHGASPILGVDVWEHSYYIDYRNARPKYLEAFVDSLINWDYVLDMYEAASK